jgi:transcriptional regulator with XRE-family HTH domain
MPTPGPLGRLVARRRMELGLTQQELAELTAKHGVPFTQNNISRLESGKTQRINDPARLEALSKALGLESDAEFIIAAYAPNAERILTPGPEILPPGPDGEIVALIRRIPQSRKRQAIELLRMMAGEDLPASK